MSTNQFLLKLGITTAISAVLLLGLHQIPAMQQHWPVSVASVILFSVISILLFFMGENSARSSNKFAFNGLVTISVLGKIVFSMVVLLIYFKVWKPDNRLFVVPFLLIYVIYTIFETAFLLKLAQLKSGSK
jgi:hypothetical protein